MRKINVNPAYRALKFVATANDIVKITVEVDYEIDMNHYTNDTAHLALNEKDTSVEKRLFSMISDTLFDSSSNHMTAERVRLKTFKVSPALAALFETYRKEYFGLKNDHENFVKQKEIAALEEQLKALKSS